jgi:hypothetical protein
MEKILSTYSRSICFCLALVIAAILSIHHAMGSVIPILDGEGYAMRTFAVYGDLHAGQWHAFWELLERPNQSILAPHDFLFFMLPASLAGTASYTALQVVTTYLLLAYAVGKVAGILNRPAWAPVVFLFVSVNNIALIDFYDFYLDMMFGAFVLLVIAFQMNAWKENRAQASILSGALLGLLFFVKPANALMILVTYGLSEIFYAVGALRSAGTKKDRQSCLRDLVVQGGYRLVGFIPVMIAVGLCGGAQTILQLIDRNEVTEQFSAVEAGGLLRLFYFPLCLAACYHVVLLGGLIGAAVIYCRWRPDEGLAESRPVFPMQFFLPIALAYLFLGEVFSFWLLAKPIRALLLTLPLFGFLGCWGWERGRLRLAPLMLAVSIYAGVAFFQKAFDVMGTRDQPLEDTYQLTWESLVEMPSPWHHGSGLISSICDFVSHDAPPTGIICVNSPELRGALAWRLNYPPLLQGKMPPYQVRTLFNYQGEYDDKALDGANVISLITFLPVQSSRAVWLRSLGLVSYGNDEWCAKGRARLSAMPSIGDESLGCDFVFDQPLTQADVDGANNSAALFGALKGKPLAPDALYGRHYSRAEAWQLLQQWFDKRF